MSVNNYFNSETCKRCGLCAAICPNRIIEKLESGEVGFCSDRLDLCIRCGHCMAICPTKSIKIDRLSYEKDFFDLHEDVISADPFSNLISTRRSIRVFKDKPVPRKILQKIIEAISMAPMGFPPHKVEVTVISDREVIEKALPIIVKIYKGLEKIMRNPIIRFFMKKSMKLETFNSVKDHVLPVMKIRLPFMEESGEDDITRGAPAMFIFHANRASESHTDDALIDLTYGLLAAHSLGLGATAIGLVPPAVERNKELRKMFKIPKENEVITSMVVGYPKYRFKRGIVRELANVVWI